MHQLYPLVAPFFDTGTLTFLVSVNSPNPTLLEMIEISNLSESDKGRQVVYHREYCDREVGILSSWNDKVIFVRFKGPNGEACKPCDISFH